DDDISYPDFSVRISDDVSYPDIRIKIGSDVSYEDFTVGVTSNKSQAQFIISESRYSDYTVQIVYTDEQLADLRNGIEKPISEYTDEL
ncbi:MAG: hypothetical protein HON12_06470, partial [Flavobacteriales bacterium]|nr:hypothetical protein [Flavobacteriales bacterium]